MKSGVAVCKVPLNSVFEGQPTISILNTVHFEIWYHGTKGTERFEYYQGNPAILFIIGFKLSN